MTAAWVRSDTPNLSKIALTWFRTVPSERYRRAAISALFSPLANQTQHISFTLGQFIGQQARGLGLAAGDLPHQFACHGGVHEGLARQRAMDGLDHFFARCVFEQVPGCARADSVEDPFVIVVGGQHQYFDRRKLCPDLTCGFDTVHTGHFQVH